MMIEQEINKLLYSFGNTYKLPVPFWSGFEFLETENEVEATVYVDIKLLPNPMFLTDIIFATMLQKLVSNPFAKLEDGRDLRLYFATIGNGQIKESAFKKLGNNPENNINFYLDMQEQSLKKLGSYIEQLPVDAAIAYLTVRGLTALIGKAMEAGAPQRHELPGGIVLHTDKRRIK